MLLCVHAISQVGTVTENVKFSQSALSATLSFKRVSMYNIYCIYVCEIHATLSSRAVEGGNFSNESYKQQTWLPF